MNPRFENEKFTLVLSGGGALGLAHLGVLHDLERHSLVPGEIVGTSMGGIIGACMAIGMKEREIYEQVRAFAGVYNWIAFSLSGNAVIDNKKIARIFDGIFKGQKMGETEIPLKLIATDLHTGDKRVFDASDNVLIKDAVLATMAIPGIFSERIIDGSVYGDGFLCENLGITEATFDDVVAVDVLGQNAFRYEMPDNILKTANILEMFEKSMRLLIYNQTRSHLRHCTKRIALLEPDTKAYKTFHFHKTDAIRALGLELLEKALHAWSIQDS
jgi:NTE family protein